MDAGLKGVNGCMSAHVAWVGAVFGVCQGAGGLWFRGEEVLWGKVSLAAPPTDRIPQPTKN